MVFFLSFYDDVEEALDLNLTDRLEEFSGYTSEADFLPYLLIGVVFFLLVSFIITLVRTIFQFYNLRFWQTENGFNMESGLFTKLQVSANLQKIQYIRWDSSPLKRLFGMAAVRLPQAASVQVSRKLSANVPGCYQEHLEAIKTIHFPNEKDFAKTRHGVHWRIIYRMFLIQGIVPVALVIAGTYNWTGNSVWFWLLWLPVGLWLSVQYYRTWYWDVSEEGVQISWGVVNRHDILLQWYKVQAVSVRQSYFLRRRGLAFLIFYTAAGAVTIPYIPLDKALALQDYVLHRVEIDRRKWM